MMLDVKEYFAQILMVNHLIRVLRTQIDILEEKRLFISSLDLSSFKARNSPNPTDFNKLSDAYLDLIDKYKSEEKRLVELKEEAKSLIDRLDNPIHRAIMIDRYINNRSWRAIADDFGYGYKYLLNHLQPKILRNLKKGVEQC